MIERIYKCLSAIFVMPVILSISFLLVLLAFALPIIAFINPEIMEMNDGRN